MRSLPRFERRGRDVCTPVAAAARPDMSARGIGAASFAPPARSRWLAVAAAPAAAAIAVASFDWGLGSHDRERATVTLSTGEGRRSFRDASNLSLAAPWARPRPTRASSCPLRRPSAGPSRGTCPAARAPRAPRCRATSRPCRSRPPPACATRLSEWCASGASCRAISVRARSSRPDVRGCVSGRNDHNDSQGRAPWRARARSPCGRARGRPRAAASRTRGGRPQRAAARARAGRPTWRPRDRTWRTPSPPRAAAPSARARRRRRRPR